MALRSLGLASDALVMRGLSVLEAHPDRVVMRTPGEPDYWFGNMVIFREDHVAPEAQIARFRADFPEARHVTIAWDVPGMAGGPRLAGFSRRGFDIEETEVLSLRAPLGPAAAPEGIEIRPLESDADWAAATALQIATGLAEGHAAEMYVPFTHARMATRRAQVARDEGRWFGAFDGAALVGDFGIFAAPALARFQSVEVAPTHRRRGIAAAMVAAGTRWAAERAPGAVPVIVADAGSDAGRVYRRCGYGPEERLLAVCKGG